MIVALQDGFVYSKVVEAKDILIAECKKASISDSIKEYDIKRMAGKSGALNRVVSDAVDIWTVIDRELKGEISVQFVAANPNHLPNVNLEKFNVQFLISTIEKLHETVESQKASLTDLQEKVQTLCNNNNNNNNNNNKNKRKLSGSSAEFTPKRFQTGVDSFISVAASIPPETVSTSSAPLTPTDTFSPTVP